MGLTTLAGYAVVALGYTMVYGVLNLINFAHGDVLMIGAMVAFTVISALAPGGMPPLAVVASLSLSLWRGTRGIDAE